jgi:hypothetical protein
MQITTQLIASAKYVGLRQIRRFIRDRGVVRVSGQ